ncbi:MULTISPECIES: hypothetical protein [unclassified Mesorhizobium]|uniref:hypothetical protein n=1 Tax=unclassified Mesorhizobium TaxID=325217 RepID=UPI00112CCFB0|nr:MULTISPECIES: hypothetical protein [unclassified Mesorhizobium]MCA0025486.1 hypothetical protein [Mesorhizobium sp. B263B1A]TPJ97127.1 hypothetical protein FJ489_11855 [Mesorhizobium sp. B2-5-12]TPK27206.1 hypothetical protein FJ562_08170 [Mesorhizobium sp. B2-5-6]
MPDVKWLDALSLPARIMGGLFLFSVLALSCNRWWMPLPLVENWKALFVLGLLLTGCLFGAAMIALSADAWRKTRVRTQAERRRSDIKAEHARVKAEIQANVLKRLDHLSRKEVGYFAQALRNNSQSITGWVHSADLSTLMDKGLLTTPGGNHHQDHYPFWIPDLVWQELLGRRDEFIAKDDDFTAKEKADKTRGR